jgi:hypothetical protein
LDASAVGIADEATGSLGAAPAAEDGASGGTIAACGSAPMAVLIRSHNSALGSTAPTIWFSTPSLNSQAWTKAVKSCSAAIMASTCVRSSASSVPSAYSAASALWSSL